MRLWLLPLFLLLPLSASADTLIGLGYLNGLTGLNLEWAGKRNSFYGMPAYYLDSGGLDTEELRWVAGWRHKLERGKMAEKGFYSGVLVGDLGGERHYERLGVGLELGHQWVTPYSRWTVSAAMGAMEPLDCEDYHRASRCDTPEERDQYDLDVEPTVVLGVSFSLRR
ncbi:hypothetical protein A11A3_10926 [Alcanivorax hongdengensis A-11-3]|uniref:DUF3575 domain-containing protein n=1 Tax=Alcanivorax hongdengensis A-11-3 TaxID=1177179 RepID=L0WAI9_9GAMM|nr:hypothetical protein [Alcanivorax hongdengensis]EKF74014.1 hypothetical protein A11A3_10926 [Alcanivorax hongdengensis A-11-3]